MKKIISLVSVLLIGFAYQSYSQIDTSKISTIVNVNFTSNQFAEAVKKVQDFVATNNVYIERQNEEKTNFNAKFIFNETQYKQFEKLMPEIGFVYYKNITTTNNNKESEDVQFEIAYLLSQKQSYEVVLAKMDENSQQYLTTWKELKEIEERIFQKEQTLLKYKVAYNTFTVDIEIKDETFSQSSSRVAFVNMPGVEYSFLQIESPLTGLSTEFYQGYFLKYLFTKGKSYVNIGAYKAFEGSTVDSSYFSEMFLMSFGQDFYSRYLGRGSKKSLNLYSSYSVGGMLASGITSKEYLGYIAPAIGIEFFKNKYVLFDTKVSYFVPLTDYNRNIRGISVSASLNFVF